MFGNIKKFAAKKLLETQLKSVPKDQQELILGMFEKDPQLFEEIAKEIQAEMKKGSNQMSAAMKVMPKYQGKLQALMGEKAPNQTIQGFNPNGSIRK